MSKGEWVRDRNRSYSSRVTHYVWFLVVAIMVLYAAVFASRAVGKTYASSTLAFEVRFNARRDDEIFAADVGRQLVVNVSRNPTAADIRPAWSPSGHLAYVSRDRSESRLLVLDTATLDARAVSSGVQVAQTRPAWSPGGRLAFVGWDERTTANHIFVVNVDQPDALPVDVTPEPVAEVFSADWLSSTELVVEARVAGTGEREIIRVSLETGELTRIYGREPMNTAPLVSVEHRAIIFQSWRSTNTITPWHVYLWREDAELEILYSFYRTVAGTYPAAFRNHHATFHGRLDSQQDIYLWDLADDSQTRLTRNAFYERESSISADGQIAFTDDRNGHEGVYVLDPATRQVTTIYDDHDARSLTWSH